MPVIGFLSSGPRIRIRLRGRVPSGARRTGFVDGRNVAIEYRWADGPSDRLPALAADLVRRAGRRNRGDRGHRGAARGQGRDRTIPIVSPWAAIRSSRASSPASAGRAATSPARSAHRRRWRGKRLGLLRELFRARALIAVLLDPRNSAVAKRVEGRRGRPPRRRTADPDFLRAPRPRSTRRSQRRASARRSATGRRLPVLQQPSHAASSRWRRATALPAIYRPARVCRGRRPDELRTSITEAIGKPASTPAAFSRAKSPPTCRCCSRPSSSW